MEHLIAYRSNIQEKDQYLFGVTSHLFNFSRLRLCQFIIKRTYLVLATLPIDIIVCILLFIRRRIFVGLTGKKKNFRFVFFKTLQISSQEYLIKQILKKKKNPYGFLKPSYLVNLISDNCKLHINYLSFSTLYVSSKRVECFFSV